MIMAARTGRGGTKVPTPRKVRQTAAARASMAIEALLGGAEDVLTQALLVRQTVIPVDADGVPQLNEDGTYKTMQMGGNAGVAMYVIDRAWPKKGAVLPKDINADISTMQGVIDCATEATRMVITRELSLQDANDLMDYLLRYCQLKAFDHINELKVLIKEFEAQGSGNLTKIDEGLVPQWGKITAMTKTANDIPAE
jgi:hypothetical protein